MIDDDEYEYFNLRKQTKTYISKVFTFNQWDTERVRNVRIVMEGNDQVLLGEIEGAMCLRLTGDKRRRLRSLPSLPRIIRSYGG